MLSGYDFSNCDIPVRLDLFLNLESQSGCKGSPKYSLKIRWQELCREKAVLWRGSGQNATMAGSSASSFMAQESCGKTAANLKSLKRQQKENKRNQKPGDFQIFQSAAESRPDFYLWNRTHKQAWSVSGGEAVLVRLAWDVRATSPTSPTGDRHGVRRGTIVPKQEGAEGRGRVAAKM